MKELRDLLNRALRRANVAAPVEAAMVMDAATKGIASVFGPDSGVVPISFAKGLLRLHAPSAAAAEEVQLQNARVIAAINTAFARGIVKELRFR